MSTIPPPEPRHGWADLLRLVDDVRRLAYDRSLAPDDAMRRIVTGSACTTAFSTRTKGLVNEGLTREQLQVSLTPAPCSPAALSPIARWFSTAQQGPRSGGR